MQMQGLIRTTDGEGMGPHDGLFNFTIGQRRGSSGSGPDAEKLYVVDFEPKTRTVIVGPEALLMKNNLIATQANWIQPVDGIKTLQCNAKIRSRQTEAPCKVTLFENDMLHVEFDQPQRAIAPGQAIVFYSGDEVLGGAFIHQIVAPEDVR